MEIAPRWIKYLSLGVACVISTTLICVICGFLGLQLGFLSFALFSIPFPPPSSPNPLDRWPDLFAGSGVAVGVMAALFLLLRVWWSLAKQSGDKLIRAFANRVDWF